jgi:hypothetical protein
MKLTKIQGHDGMAIDENGVIHNINKSEIEAARERKRLRKEKDAEIDALKNDVSEMKEMLAKIIERL